MENIKALMKCYNVNYACQLYLKEQLKKDMINPKNKRVQVTLPGETVELLESLSNRYNKTNSEIVKWAINVLAAKKSHNFVIKLREQKDEIKEENLEEINLDEEPKKDDNDIIDFFTGR